ncbi:MAG: diguanylate cyclase [Proteobacteria bacterium]|nr:diguanylate cyclase [Pseudomonadota bacterium]
MPARPLRARRVAVIAMIAWLAMLILALPAWAHVQAHSTLAHAASPAMVSPEAIAVPASTIPTVAATQGPRSAAAVSVGAMRFADGIILSTTLYTALVMLLLIGGGMYAALRDRQYLHYLGYVGAVLLFLLARNGHLQDMPGLQWFAAWGALGVYALANVLTASIVVVARGFANTSRVAPTLDRAIKLFPIGPGLLALACMLDRAGSAGLLSVATAFAWFVAVGLAIAATAVAWRQRQRLALPMLLMWLFVLVAGTLHVMRGVGMIVGEGWVLVADQVMFTANALVMGMVMTGHIIEFRLQRDRASLAKEQADASLKLERERLKFIEALHTTLRDAPSGDQEWLGFRRLLEVVRELVPQSSSAVAVHAFQDNDLLLCEPNTTRDAYQQLLAARSGAFKGISRSQLPMQLRVDAPAPAEGEQAELIQVAVIPLPMTAPAWGMLLVERRGWQGFEREELNVAAELAQKATRAVEDAANDRVLRINAEFDALTAVFNRRTMDNRLAAYFKESQVHRTSLAILFADVDHLQETNEVYGHAAGDQTLRTLADALKAHCGTAGVVGRYGSDKFVVILPDFNPEQARRWAEAMREEVNGKLLDVGNGKSLRVSVSAGIASRLAEDADVHTIIDRAEKALAASKRSGRGTVQAPPIQGVANGPRSR